MSAEFFEINIEAETLLTPHEAAKHQALRNPNGKPCNLAKIHRLFSTGVRGADGGVHRLLFVKTPTGRMTSREAIARFIRALTFGDRSAVPASTMTAAAARRSQAATDRELDEAGIG